MTLYKAEGAILRGSEYSVANAAAEGLPEGRLGTIDRKWGWNDVRNIPLDDKAYVSLVVHYS